MQWVVIGLGNPGEEYAHTRHNAGREAVVFFAEMRDGAFVFNKKMNAEACMLCVGKGKKAEDVLCLLPDTFMNKSGSAAASVVKSKKAAERLIVLQDDIDLPSGSSRIGFNRGSGGHKGVESIMRALGTKAFIRVRIGVAKASAKGKAVKPKTEDAVIDYILKPLKAADYALHKKNLSRAAEAVEIIITEGLDRAMNVFN